MKARVHEFPISLNVGQAKSQNGLNKYKGHTTMQLMKSKGQNLIEYAIVVAVVTAAVAAMSTYVFRSAQATQKAVTEEFTN